jgi:hypothetical protein
MPIQPLRIHLPTVDENILREKYKGDVCAVGGNEREQVVHY